MKLPAASFQSRSGGGCFSCRLRRVLAAILGCLLAVAGQAQAQSAENVAVVINEKSPESQLIGEHYARARGLPSSNVLRIQSSTGETVDRNAYLTTIERPLAAAIRRAGLQDRLLYLVLTKGVPLRVAGTTGLTGTVASVDSELTLLYRKMTGVNIAAAGRVENPYFLGDREIKEARPFTHREHDVYLVTRIDAFTVDQALALISTAQTPRTDGRIVLDGDDPTSTRPGREWFERAARRLREQGHEARLVLESSAGAARNVASVLGYYSWGAAASAKRERTTAMGFSPGSIAASLASFDARTFRQPPEGWQPGGTSDRSSWFEGSSDPLVGDLIREGVSGVSGQVGEAYVLGAVRPDILFPAYLAGFNLAESFYLALPSLSWHAIVVGDPLCRPFAGKVVTRADIEADLDADTNLPGLFAKRRIAHAVATTPDIPQRAVVLGLRAETLIARGDLDGARQALNEAIGIAPKVPAWLLLLASADMSAGNVDGAIAHYRSVLKLQPDNVVALNDLAYTLAVGRNAPAEALPFAKRAATLAPRFGTVLDTWGWIEHLLGNNTAAARILDDAIKVDPGLAELRLHAAVVAAALGNTQRAATELGEALRLNPALEDSEEARTVRERIAR